MTARDRGHVEEIITHLRKVESDYRINLSEEIEWLRGLNLQEEPVSEIDFEQELYKAFGRVNDFTLGMQIAKRFYEMGRKYHEPVSGNKQ